MAKSFSWLSNIFGKSMETDPSTSSGLLARLQNPTGDPEEIQQEWRRFLALYGPLLERYLKDTGLSQPDAADVTQETLLQVVRLMPGFTFDRSRGRFRDWLRRVARHCRLVHLRKLPPKGSLTSPSLDNFEAPGDVSVWEELFHARVLQGALTACEPRFSPSNWQAFIRTWQQGEPAAKVASDLEIPLAQVYLARSRILAAIRREVDRLACE